MMRQLFIGTAIEMTMAHLMDVGVKRADGMTIHDYHMAMKSVKIAELKARLSEHLRQVRRGHVLTVLDRDTPVAQLAPYMKEADALRVRHPLRRVASLHEVPIPPPLKIDIDAADLLAEERQSER
jgi:antitoxin (DNA-binding transcriptional repressor) of toxin-antitoxin stability system